MREIKFRGKRADSSEWTYGHFLVSQKNDKTYYIVADVLDSELYVIETKTLGQYTGLKDKNGKEIWEGDVVSTNTLQSENWEEGSNIVNYVVGFNNGTYCLMFKGDAIRQWEDGTHDWYSIENNDLYTIEVIGNIHENPELLDKLINK